MGDAGFQAKCKAKIIEQYKSGKILLNATHTTKVDTMKRFIDRAIWLDRGKLAANGDFMEIFKLKK